MAWRPKLLHENGTTKYKKWRGNSWVDFIYKLEEIGAEFSMKAVISAIGPLQKTQWSRTELKNKEY